MNCIKRMASVLWCLLTVIGLPAQDLSDNYFSGDVGQLWEEFLEAHTEEEAAILLEAYTEWQEENTSRPEQVYRPKIKTDIIGQARLCLQAKQGYLQTSDSLQALSKASLGNPLSLSLRCAQSYQRHCQWGFVIEKDAGESGLDYFSGHLLLRDIKVVKTLAIGDCRVCLGQGLILSSGFFGGKSAASNVALTSGRNIRRHYSLSEAGFMRGLAAEIALGKHWQTTVFISRREIDSYRTDSVFTSLKTDGLHRTVKEQAKRANTLLWQAGGQIAYQRDYWQLSLNTLFFRYDAVCNPTAQPYNLFYFRDSVGMNLSLHYRLLWQGILFSGESAMDAQGHSAHLLNADYRLHPQVRAFFSARYYSPQYNAPFAAAFSEGSGVRNEAGFYVGLNAHLWKHFSLNGYVDCFYFPWLRYGVHAPSSGYDLMWQITYCPSPDWEVLLRYKEKTKEANVGDTEMPGIYPCRPHTKRQWRGQLRFGHLDWRFKTAFEFNSYTIEAASAVTKTFGTALAQEIRYAPVAVPWQLGASFTLFDTDTYQNSIYFYEQDLPQTFSIPSLSGQGLRYALLWGCRWGEHWRFYLKLRHTLYADRDIISSGLEQISGRRSTILACQLKCSF